MGEKSAKIGRKLEGFGENLISDLGWDELTRDREIICKRPAHKKKTHGIDLLCAFDNPYFNGKQGIVIECKNRQMQNISRAEIEKWVKELINTIECSQSSDELDDIDKSCIRSLNTGLLLVHANDVWDGEKFYEYLEGISVSSRRNPINIYIAGNDKIDLWTSLLKKVKTDFSAKFSFIYPSLNEYSKRLQPALTINALYSKYLFAESTYYITQHKGSEQYSEPCRQNIMFFLDHISIDNFKYAWSMFKYYQMQGADKYVFAFYPREAGQADFVREKFITSIKQGDPHISDEDIKKISLDFIDNRTLSPVEIGGTK